MLLPDRRMGYSVLSGGGVTPSCQEQGLLRPVRRRGYSVLSGGEVTSSYQHSLSHRKVFFSFSQTFKTSLGMPVTNVECTFCPDVPLSLRAINSLALAVKFILY